MFDHPYHSSQLSEATWANCTCRAAIWLCPHLTAPFQPINTEPLPYIMQANREKKGQGQSAIMLNY